MPLCTLGLIAPQSLLQVALCHTSFLFESAGANSYNFVKAFLKIVHMIRTLEICFVHIRFITNMNQSVIHTGFVREKRIHSTNLLLITISCFVKTLIATCTFGSSFEDRVVHTTVKTDYSLDTRLKHIA